LKTIKAAHNHIEQNSTFKSLGAYRRRRQSKAYRRHLTSRVGEPASSRTFRRVTRQHCSVLNPHTKTVMGYLGRLAANLNAVQQARSIRPASARRPPASAVQPLGTPVNHSRSSR